MFRTSASLRLVQERRRLGRGIAGASVAILLAAVPPALAQQTDDTLAQCQDQSVEPKARAEACTSVIERGDADRKADAHLSRGLVREQAGDGEGALADYTKAIELDGENENAWFNRGNVHESLGRYEHAVRDYDKAISINDKDADFFNNRGRVYDILGQSEKSVADFTAAIALNPRHAMAHYNRGLGQVELGDAAKALEDFDKAVQLGLSDAELWYARAIALEALGRTSEAIDSLKRTLAANPDHDQAQAALEKLQKR